MHDVLACSWEAVSKHSLPLCQQIPMYWDVTSNGWFWRLPRRLWREHPIVRWSKVVLCLHRCWGHYVLWLSVCAFVPRKFLAWYFIKHLGNFTVFTNFTLLVHLGTEMNWLNFEVKRLRVEVMARTNIVKNPLFGPLCLSSQFERSWFFVGGSAILGKMTSKGQRSRSWSDQIWSKKTEAHASTAHEPSSPICSCIY